MISHVGLSELSKSYHMPVVLKLLRNHLRPVNNTVPN